MNSAELAAAKRVLDRVMGSRPGEGVGPTEAADLLAAETGIRLTPREAWNLWIDGDPE